MYAKRLIILEYVLASRCCTSDYATTQINVLLKQYKSALYILITAELYETKISDIKKVPLLSLNWSNTCHDHLTLR